MLEKGQGEENIYSEAEQGKKTINNGSNPKLGM